MIYRDDEYYICEVSEQDKYITAYGFTTEPPTSEARKNLKRCYRPVMKIEKPKAKKAKVEAPKAEIKKEPIEESIPKGISELSWNDLRAYGKELEKEFKVELPLKSKRDEIEKAINKLLEG